MLATLGGSGAVLVTADGAWHATPPPTTVVSTVGAGDSSLFGYLLGDLRGVEPAERLRARRRLRQRRRRPARHHDPDPGRPQLGTRELVDLTAPATTVATARHTALHTENRGN